MSTDKKQCDAKPEDVSIDIYDYDRSLKIGPPNNGFSKENTADFDLKRQLSPDYL